MTTEVSITATQGPNNRPLEELEKLIAQRVKFLKSETTEYAVTATAVNILKSIRAATKKVDPDKASNGFKAEASSSLVPGFKSEKGAGKTKERRFMGLKLGKSKSSNHARRVLRAEGGHEITGVPVINLAGKYVKGETVNAYIVVFKYQTYSRAGNADKYQRVYVIAKSQEEVNAWAKRWLKKRIAIYSGMAKWILGHAMYLVVKGGYSSGHEENVQRYARRQALAHLSVQTAGVGWSSGSYSVKVVDDLNYAEFALTGGIATLENSLMKAANSTAAIINRLGNLPLDQKLSTPFPEIAHSK